MCFPAPWAVTGVEVIEILADAGTGIEDPDGPSRSLGAIHDGVVLLRQRDG